MMKPCVVVFAKVPEAGGAKTRIARETDRATADRIYAELLAVTAEGVRPFEHVVSYPGAAGPGSLRQRFPRAAGFIRQEGASLGQRLLHVLERLKDSGYAPLCALGADCPTLTPADVERAFQALGEGHDVALGPAEDGGYWLVAVNDPRCGIFEASAWGRPELLTETLAIAERRGLRCFLLQERADIDTMADYERWRRPRQGGQE